MDKPNPPSFCYLHFDTKITILSLELAEISQSKNSVFFALKIHITDNSASCVLVLL